MSGWHVQGCFRNLVLSEVERTSLLLPSAAFPLLPPATS